jgi:hypothetical protein
MNQTHNLFAMAVIRIAVLIAGIAVAVAAAAAAAVNYHHHHDDDDDYGASAAAVQCFAGETIVATCAAGNASAVEANIVNTAMRNSKQFVQLAFRAGEEATLNLARKCQGQGSLDGAIVACYGQQALGALGLNGAKFFALMRHCGIVTFRQLLCLFRACGDFAASL